MTDDRKKSRRAPSVMGDDDRALVGHARRRTPAREFPVHVDAEATPPPQPPPSPEALEGFDQIAPEIREQLKLLSTGLGEVTEAIGKVWDSRKDSDRISKLHERFDTLASNDADHRAAIEEFLKPAVKAMMARVDTLLQYHEGTRARVEMFYEREWPAAQKALEVLGERLGRIERTQERQESDLRGLAQRVSTDVTSLQTRIVASEITAAAIDARVAKLERRNDDTDAGDKRELALSKKQQRSRMAAVGIVSFVVSLAAQAIGWLTK